MKTINYKKAIKYICIVSVLFFIISCNKDEFSFSPLSSLVVINAISGGDVVNLGSNSIPIENNYYAKLRVQAGENDLYIWPVGDSIHPYYTYPKFNAEDRGVYSLFLCGTLVTGVEGILLKESLPYHGDSTCGVRFINLNPSGTALNITMSATPNINEVSGLKYKQYTDFKTYPATNLHPMYTFEIRRASDNMILTTYDLYTPFFANVTLVINSDWNVILINNDR